MEFTNQIQVELLQHVGNDATIASAARVSTVGAFATEEEKGSDAKLINYLVKHKHGSPFEHNSMTFRVQVPIFVAREWMRHRVGWSYNEVSGRYTELEPRFYVYGQARPLVQQGSSAHPKLVEGPAWLNKMVNGALVAGYRVTWKVYQQLLEWGAAKEVARAILPVGLYTEFYVTTNARGMMSFLSLRTSDAGTSSPQFEIEVAAHKMEEQFAKLFPATYESFQKNGRQAP